MQGRRGAGEGKHAGDDLLELLDFLGDDLQVAAARVVCGEVGAERAVEEFDDGERIPDLVGDLGGEQAEGGEGLVFTQHLLRVENAGVESGVLQGDGGETGEGREKPFLIVAEPVRYTIEDREHPGRRALEDERCGQGRAERGIAGEVRSLTVAGAIDVLKLGGLAGANDRGEQRDVGRHGLLLQG